MLRLKEASAFLGISVETLLPQVAAETIAAAGPEQARPCLSPEALRAILRDSGKRFARSTGTIGMEKGGVGKSFLSINAAVALAGRGCRVLVIDLDPEACATNFLLPPEAEYHALGTILEIFTQDSLAFRDAIVPTRYPGLDLVACKGKARRLNRMLGHTNPKKLLRSKMDGLAAYDLILFEVPPTFGDLVSSAYLTSDLVVLPVLPDIWSIESIALTMEDIREECEKFELAPPRFRILLNRYNPGRSASREALALIQERYTDLLFPFQVREYAAVQNSVNEGVSIFEQACPDVVHDALRALADALCPVVAAKKLRNPATYWREPFMRKPREPNREDEVAVPKPSAGSRPSRKSKKQANPVEGKPVAPVTAAATAAPAAPKQPAKRTATGASAEVSAAPMEAPPTAATEVPPPARTKAKALVNRYILYTCGIGVVPVPIADVMAGGALQMNMIDELATCYGFRPSRAWIRQFIVLLCPSLGLAYLGQASLGSLSKLAPGVGTLIGMATMPVFLGATTYALGTILVEHFEAGGCLANLDIPAMKKALATRFADGRKVADRMLKSAEAVRLP